MDTQNLKAFIKGTCQDMCPESERRMREREKLLHPLEILQGTQGLEKPLADPTRTVKVFSRSAAGRRTSSPHDLRPLPVLKKTLEFLFSHVKFRRSEDWVPVYDFIFDRVRAVNQDAVIQGIDNWEGIYLYQSIVRFLVYSSYRLSCEPKYRYDPVINFKHLQESLKKTLRLCDEQHMMKEDETCFFPEFEALYLLINLGDPEAIVRGIERKAHSRMRDFETALEMSLAFWQGNYVRVLNLLKELPLLLSCAATLHIPVVRRKALKIMSISYSNKNLSFPCDDLQRILHYCSREHLLEDCTHYKICVKDERVQFLKGSFDDKADLVTPRPSVSLDQKLNVVNLPDLLLNGG
ncbi:SAC3 domain-containing protein 1 [Ischnura elegans]|uniref:SAC3 domain-containing protein 1 n=1 Tax=Ischnura elegans TaxID=197161 RepID=UPI001ED86C03|nr:SAC3 domain-containing protein 1 [Ischnura elegans]